MIGRKKNPDVVLEHAKNRLDRLPSVEILNWLDQAGSGMARALGDFRRSEDPEILVEAREGALALVAGIELLQGRSAK